MKVIVYYIVLVMINSYLSTIDVPAFELVTTNVIKQTDFSHSNRNSNTNRSPVFELSSANVRV